MGAVEDAVDAAASFVGLFLDRARSPTAENFNAPHLAAQALSHLQSINAADLAADPNAPYDASLAGVVYSLLDLTTITILVPQVSPGVAFSQRPKSIITSSISTAPEKNESLLAQTIRLLLSILRQESTGIQPLVLQRSLPDIISALAELSFSPASNSQDRLEFSPIFQKTVADTPTSRILPIFTTLLQQPLPSWLKPIISQALALVPARPHGIRHTVEFLSLAHLSKTSSMPQDVQNSQSRPLIPLEAVTQASRLLVLPPTGTTQDAWLNTLAPQLWDMLDGNEGKELSRVAGQIIAGGILSKKSTGAPGAIGWKIFALPLLQTIYPKVSRKSMSLETNVDRVIVQEQDLKTNLRRLSMIASSYSHAGLLRRLVGPLLLPLWAVLNHAREKSLLDNEWTSLPRVILVRYMEIAADAKQIDTVAQNLFWSGDAAWKLGPGSQGGVEIRRRDLEDSITDMKIMLSNIADMTTRVYLFVSLLAAAKITDEIAGAIFVQISQRWLSPTKIVGTLFTNDNDIDPLLALTNAKLSEALARTFQDQFARSPLHVVELMVNIVENFVHQLQQRTSQADDSKSLSLGVLGNITKQNNKGLDMGENAMDEDLISFALSILRTLVASTAFKETPETMERLRKVLPALELLSQKSNQISVSASVADSARSLVQSIKSSTSTSSQSHVQPDFFSEHQAALKTILPDLTAAEPPNRTWALNALHALIRNPSAFPAIDVPSLTLTLLSTSLADQESYVHTAAIPVLVDLATRAPSPVIRMLVDVFIDIDERSLKLKGMQVDGKRIELQHAIDFRQRAGEVLNNIVRNEVFWTSYHDTVLRYQALQQIVEACLSLSSRRGQRVQTSSIRNEIASAEREVRAKGEAAWGGPIPNFLETEDEDENDRAEHDALLNIVHGWENSGIEEDPRIRASALSILSTIFEHRLSLLYQSTINAALQIVLLILSLETSESEAIVRRAGVLVIIGLLRSLDAAVESGRKSAVEIDLKHQEELERVVRWVRDEDIDALTRDHAANVLEGMETLRMKELLNFQDRELRLGDNSGLLGNIKGLNVNPTGKKHDEKSKALVEEVE